MGLAFHCARDGKVSIIAAPGGWPIWTSPVQPGCEHDTTPLRAHPEMLPLVAEWTDTTQIATRVQAEHGSSLL